MKLIKIDPPGTFCTHQALRDVLRLIKPKSFVDVGCGSGDVSKLLCSAGMTGMGVDFSRLAIETTSQTLHEEIRSGQYLLVEADAMSLNQSLPKSDVAISVMVMEHIEDDVGFIRKMTKLVHPEGYVAVCVPGRRDHWSFEDETVGHLRRYDRADLKSVLEAGGLGAVEVWSVAVPTANLLFGLGNWLIRHSSDARKITLSQREQTETSGIREIPWKTVFPAWVRIILNKYTLYPLLAIQRLFYRSGLGVTMLGFGRVPASDRS